MGGIRNVLQGEEIEDKTLRKILLRAGLVNDSKAEIQLKQFSSGYSNLTYLVLTEGNEFVLRRPPFGAIKRGHDMGREFKVLTALNKHWSKTPKVYFFDKDELLGVPFYIMEMIKGPIVRNEPLPATHFKQITKAWLSTFIELHSFDYKKIGLTEFGKPEGYADRQVRNWSKQYIASKTKEVKAADLVMAWMSDNIVSSTKACLIHNDFRYDNVVFKDKSWREVAAVLDWEMATIGDPLMDLGTTLAYWTMQSDPEFLKQGIPSPTVFEGNLSREELVHQYALASNRKIGNIVFYYVYGLFKIAVIAQQIFYRYKKGLTSDPKFANLEAASEGLCKMALHSIQSQKIQ